MTTNGEEKRGQIYRKCFICGLEGKRKKKKKTEKEKEENRERRALNSAWKYTTLQSGLFLMALCCVGSKKKYFCKHASQVQSWYVCCVWHQVWYTKNVDLTSGTLSWILSCPWHLKCFKLLLSTQKIN